MNKKLVWVIVIVVIIIIIASTTLHRGSIKSFTSWLEHHNDPNYGRTGPVVRPPITSITEASETEGEFVGYYTPYTRPADEVFKEEKCEALTVLSGDQDLIKYYIQIVEAGNSINKIDTNGNLVANLDITNLSTSEKNWLFGSTKNNPVKLSIQKLKESGKDGYPCLSFFKIINITR